MTTEKELFALDKAISKASKLAEKYTLEYYKEHNPNDRYGKSGISVTVMMEIEEFARWLDKQGKLTLIEPNKEIEICHVHILPLNPIVSNLLVYLGG